MHFLGRSFLADIRFDICNITDVIVGPVIFFGDFSLRIAGLRFLKSPLYRMLKISGDSPTTGDSPIAGDTPVAGDTAITVTKNL